jgi:hypothetical protein
MSAMQLKGYTVADWLAALEREERRLMRIFICMDAALAFVGLAMIAVALLWPLPQDYSRKLSVTFSICIIFIALIFVPLSIKAWHKMVDVTVQKEVYPSPLSTRLLAGGITGNELHAALPRLIRWLDRPDPAPAPESIVRRVIGASLFYQGSSWLSWTGNMLPVLLGCFVWGLAAFMGPGAEANPTLRSISHFGVVMQILGMGTAMPIFLLLGQRGQSLAMELPMLKRQWQAVLNQATD